MAFKLVDQDEAAKFLGVTIDEINELRDHKKLFPFRDGSAWKYKLDDLERLKTDRAAGGSSWIQKDDLADIPLEVNEHVESILLSEKELGQSSDSTSSTIIGKPGQKSSPSESDLQIAPEPAEPTPKAGSSDVSLAAGLSGTGSDVKLVLGGSDASKKDITASSDLDLRLEPSDSSTKKLSTASTSDSELKLADPLGIGSSKKSGSSKKTAKPGSDARKAAEAKNRFEVDDLNLDDDDVLGGKPGSDITRGATDSGIHLVDPKDSGLSLEQPLELTGSAVELLELGEADTGGATQLKSDDDFLLTPVQEDVLPDESDSGSQVIALDSEEDLSSGAFAPATSGMVAMLEEDTGEGGPAMAGLAPLAGMAASGALMTAPAVPEAPYSAWNVVGLVCCALLLLMGGIVMQDTIRNMWKWEGPEPVTKQITDSLGSTIGWMEPKK
jgi:hypothetical protein